MNLVVNLYKEQPTIKGFEESVRSLKSDIAKELKASPANKEEVVKELRSEIQSTAAKKLEGMHLLITFFLISFSNLRISIAIFDIHFYMYFLHTTFFADFSIPVNYVIATSPATYYLYH